MDAKIVGGSVWGVPFRGAVVNVTGADVAAVLAAASGLALATFSIGAAALGLGLLGTYLSRQVRRDVLPLNVLSNVATGGRTFKGVCSTDLLEIHSEGNDLSIPVKYIQAVSYELHLFSNAETVVHLIDGSRYRIQKSKPLNFLTLIGPQEVTIGGEGLAVGGCTVTEVDQFKQDLVDFLDREKKTLADALGPKMLAQFFPQHP